MIDSKDLRIGNILLDENNKLIQVETIHNDGINYMDGYIYGTKFEDLTPIKLTPEILEQGGFENNKTHFTFWINKYKCFILIVNKNGNYSLCDCDLDSDIEYLHDLQNMYKLFTKQELPIDVNTLKI